MGSADAPREGPSAEDGGDADEVVSAPAAGGGATGVDGGRGPTGDGAGAGSAGPGAVLDPALLSDSFGSDHCPSSSAACTCIMSMASGSRGCSPSAGSCMAPRLPVGRRSLGDCRLSGLPRLPVGLRSLGMRVRVDGFWGCTGTAGIPGIPGGPMRTWNGAMTIVPSAVRCAIGGRNRTGAGAGVAVPETARDETMDCGTRGGSRAVRVRGALADGSGSHDGRCSQD